MCRWTAEGIYSSLHLRPNILRRYDSTDRVSTLFRSRQETNKYVLCFSESAVTATDILRIPRSPVTFL